jgi:hypothetical protein
MDFAVDTKIPLKLMRVVAGIVPATSILFLRRSAQRRRSRVSAERALRNSDGRAHGDGENQRPSTLFSP